MKGHARGVPRNESQREFKQTPKGIHDKRCLLPTPGSPAILGPPPQHLTYLYYHLLFNPFILFSIFNFCLLKKNIVHIFSICIQWVCIHNGEAIVYMCMRENYVCVASVCVCVYACSRVSAGIHVPWDVCKGQRQLWMSILPFPLFEIVLVFCHGT